MRKHTFHQRHDLRISTNPSYKQSRIRASMAALMLGAAAAMLSPTAALAQNSYISMTGTLTSSAGYQDIYYNFSDGTRDTSFRTWQYGGGTDTAGDVIPSGGVDSQIELFSGASSIAYNDDRGGGPGNLDSLLTPFTSPTSSTYLPPLANGNYRLHLNQSDFGALQNGYWAIDMTRSGAFRLDNLVSQDSTFESLKFGADTAQGAIVRLSGGLTMVGDLRIDGGGLLDAGGTMRAASVAIAGDGVLNLKNRSLIVDYGTHANPTSTVRSYLQTGFAAGSWNGNGISSSDAATTSTPTGGAFAVGYADNAVLNYGSFAGQSVTSSSLLVRYTYAGDTNLDGKVEIEDLKRLAAKWQQSGGWSDGDFNYDGFVDATDLGFLAMNWILGTDNPLPAMSIEEAVQQVGLPVEALPEPVGTVFIAIGAASLLGRARRRAVCA